MCSWVPDTPPHTSHLASGSHVGQSLKLGPVKVVIKVILNDRFTYSSFVCFLGLVIEILYFNIPPQKGGGKFLGLVASRECDGRNGLQPQPQSSELFVFPAAHGIASGKATKRSIADSEESEAYKSLFTTHSSAKRSKEESAHWVTHTSYCF